MSDPDTPVDEIREGTTIAIGENYVTTVAEINGDWVIFENGARIALETVKRDLREGTGRVVDDR